MRRGPARDVGHTGLARGVALIGFERGMSHARYARHGLTRRGRTIYVVRSELAGDIAHSANNSTKR